MAEHLANIFVDLPHIALAPKAIPKLSFHHAIGSFDVRVLVVVLLKRLPVAHEVVLHLSPRRRIAFVWL